MANIVTSSPVAIPSVTRLKGSPATASRLYATVKKSPPSVPRLILLKASLREANVATTAIAVAASAILASNALAIDIKLGGDNGELAFVPSEFSVASGEKINFINNAGFPHNVVFDEDELPADVDASKISMSDEDLLNGPGETFSVTLTTKGTYSFYCAPHQGAGMVGKVTVN